MIDQYYDRFDASKNYEKLLFRADRVLQSAELNEIQSAAANRLRSVSDVLFKDGDVIRDAGIVVNEITGETICQSGAVYVGGAIRGVAPATLSITVNATVAVGLYLVSTVVTELEAPELRNPAVGTRGYQEPGAARSKVDLIWGFQGDSQSGEFYPIYTVENGLVRPKEAPPNLDAVTQALARYDRDSSGGSYVVSGLSVAKSADVGADQVYTVTEGRARVSGQGIELSTARRLMYTALPDLRFVDSEPHVSTTAGAQRINLDRTPVSDISSLHITSEKTETVTHGGFTGAMDTLPDTSIVALLEVKQGATTYVNGSDFKLTAGKVDWSLAGAEPAPSSTYTVKYQCIVPVAPTAPDATGFSVTGAVVGTQVLVSYNQKLSRIDTLCLDADGALIWFKGVASEYNSQKPATPASMLALASIHQTWTAARSVTNDGVRVVPMQDLANITARMDYLASMIAQQNLKTDASNRDAALKKGMFVDPFLNDGMRDQGIAQTAAIVLGQLTLPVAATPLAVDADVTGVASLAFTLEPILAQTARTGSMKVNPYLAFDAIPANVTLTPAVDRWAEVATSWNSAITQRIIVGSGNVGSVSSSTANALLSSSSANIETLRPIQVNFTISGFGPNEQLTSVTFDGIAVASSAP